MTLHHSYDPEIIFDSPTKARGIWAMSGGALAKGDDHDIWSQTYGYYYETYEKRDGRWLFTTRRWHNYFSFGSEGVNFPKDPPKGSDAFDERHLRRYAFATAVNAVGGTSRGKGRDHHGGEHGARARDGCDVRA